MKFGRNDTLTGPKSAPNRPVQRTWWWSALVGSSLFCSGIAPGLAQAQQGSTPPAAAPAGEKSKGEEKKFLKSKDFYLNQGGSSQFEQLAREKRDEAIVKLKEILDSGNIEGDQKAEMYMRLASLYSEAANDSFLQEMASFTEKYDAWFNSPDSKKTPPPPEDHVRSQGYNRQAVELYRTILAGYRSYPRMDEVYFNLAFILMDLGDKAQALEFYNTLVKSFPNSDFVPDTYLAIGEYWFENNNAFKALGNYKKAATYSDSRVYIFALYKLGWCYYNVGESAKALETMKQVITISGDGSNNKLSLREEALNDLVLFYADSGDMDAAYAYFSQFGEKKYFKAMLKRLASTYIEQGRNELAITTFRRMIAEEPDAKDAPSFQGEIIAAYFRWNHKPETIHEIDVLAETYGPGSRWATLNQANKDAIKDANDLVERNLRTVALDYHKEARKTGSKSTYTLAANSYQKYLRLFPKNQYSYDIRFAYAEVLYELKEFEKAAAEYQAVIDLDNKGKHFQVAANSLILTINKILGVDKPDAETSSQPSTSVGQKDRDTKPVALSAWEQQKIRVCDLYADMLPQDKDSPATLYEAARMLYDKNQFDQATPRFLKIIERYPAEDVAEISANLVLDSYNVLQDWPRVEQYARQFAVRTEFKEGMRKEMRDIYEKAAFKKVEPLEKAGKNQEAADAYAAFYNEFKATSTLSDRALYNAAFYSFKAGDAARSIQFRQELDKVFPKSSLTAKNLESLGKAFESIADYGQAARYYERLAVSEQKAEIAFTPDGLYNAALFREALGEWQQSIANYEAYYRDYATKDDAYLVILEVGRIYESNAKPTEAMATYKRFFTTPELSSKSLDATWEARIRYGRLQRKLGQNDAALAHYQESTALFDKLSKGATGLELAPLYNAEMRFMMLEPLFNRFVAIKLDLVKTKKGSRANSLEEKLKMTEEVVNAYAQILELKQGEWGIAALCQIGKTYSNLAETILAAPVPPELTEDQRKIYLAALQDRAFPLKDKAAEAFENALNKVYELGIYNAYSAEASAMMAVLRPKEYPALAEKLSVPERLSDTFLSADYVR